MLGLILVKANCILLQIHLPQLFLLKTFHKLTKANEKGEDITDNTYRFDQNDFLMNSYNLSSGR